MDPEKLRVLVSAALKERGWDAKALADTLHKQPGFDSWRGAKVWVDRLLEGSGTRPTAIRAETCLKLLGIDNPDAPSTTIPVVAFASAGRGEMFTDQGAVVGEGMYRVERPNGVSDPNAFGVEVDGDSMEPHYYEGQVVVVDTTKEVTNGCFVVVGLTTGEKFIKRWRATDGKVVLESVNSAYPPVTIKRERVRFVYRIVWSKER